MLFLLTGDIQTGKTRWLTRMVGRLADEGVTSYGVLAPGRWLEPDVNGNREKVGIDNVLLPDGRRIDFAMRRDLIETNTPEEESRSSRAARLKWAIRDEAMTTVNDHFARLMNGLENADGKVPALLVVDELGRLELVRNEGLTNAVAFAERFPKTAAENAARHGIIVVRPWLVDEAKARFTPTWGEPICIVPGENAEHAILNAFNLA